MSQDNTQAIIDVTRQTSAATKIAESDNIEHWFVPGVGQNPGQIKQIEKSFGAGKPARKSGAIQVYDAASFNAVLAANDDAGDITIYINRDAVTPSIVAVLNDHGETGAGWGDLRAEIVFRPTPQWEKWRRIDGRLMPQIEFAEFVEENLSDIVDPAGAAMLEIAQDLSVKRSVDFKSALRLSDGTVQFQNIESTDASVKAGEVKIPEMITLAVAPVFGVAPFKINARFRYRLDSGKLRCGIKMDRVADVMWAVVNDMVHGTEGVVGIVPPQGAVMVEGIAPALTK